MLNIYYARENIDKDRFMFDRIREALDRIRRRDGRQTLEPKPGAGRSCPVRSAREPRHVLLLVPEQYTLQTERNAFACLEAPGFIDFEVLSLTSFGRRLLSETGGVDLTFINRYGKFMLIAGLLHRRKHSLMTFRNLEASSDFVDKLNDMIAELKNFNVTPEALAGISEGIGDDGLLKRKLADVAVIYAGYEERLKGRYTDAADYLKLFTSKISKSVFAAETEIWLSAFDYLNPAAMDAVTELAVCAPSVNLVLTAEPGNAFFRLTNTLIEDIGRRAADAGAETNLRPIEETFAHRKPAAVAHIEQCLFSYPRRTYDGRPIGAGTPQDGRPREKARNAGAPGVQTQQGGHAPGNARDALRLVAAANYYAEAETAAARIVELTRDEGLRYRDILILCNDMGARASVIKRVFARYGLPLFMDQRRGVEHNPALEYILALLSIVSGGWSYESVFRFLKTGLTGLDREAWEELENYVCKYRIRGNLWKKDFTYGGAEYSQEEMDGLNETRRKIAALIGAFETPFRRSGTAGEKTQCLHRFLADKARLPGSIDRLTDVLQASGDPQYAEYAAEMSGIWDVIEEIFAQLIAVMGDLPMRDEEYAGVIRAGFFSVRMGILPPSPDQLVLGTMQRTRSGAVEALFVLGANDGVLPMYDADDTILNEDEKVRLAAAGRMIGRENDNLLMEEQLAVYRNLSKPGRLLHVSYSISDNSGKDMKPSVIFEQLRRLFPGVPAEKDILNDGSDPLRLVQYPDETMSHLTERLQRCVGGERLSPVWKDVYLWFKADGREALNHIRAGLTFRNRRENIDERFVSMLYGGADKTETSGSDPAETAVPTVLVTSPSALERFSHCPFAFFLDRGVRVKERRIFEIDGRNVGDVYHEVLMRYGAEMMRDGLSVSDEGSAWRTVTEAESAVLVGRIYDEVASEFKEGLLLGGGYERYKSERIKRIASDVAWIVTRQVRSGAIADMRFETVFGDGGEFPAVEVTKDGKRVRVQGRMDRVDVLEGGYARIIDYKSGAETFSRDDVLGGWQLQLMLYLLAVRERYQPAGAFYFKIAEPRVEDKGKEDVADGIMKAFRLDGLAPDDPQILAALGEPVRSAAPEEFEAMQDSVKSLVTDLCGKLLSGNIDAEPMTAKKIKAGAGNKPMTACTYCSYRGVCNFDRAFG
ncbi:MAG: exodeoxyribonuclease V subunit gamma [Clostridiales Family XIII bacterium]|jgi:ATP-dependent helicase/nuclease subunit B|nr:exodeoxyribonuclease V subunit gamma [Clostridiales Family XIII bacterium]